MKETNHSRLSTTKPQSNPEEFIAKKQPQKSNIDDNEPFTMFSVQIPVSLRKRIRIAAVSEDLSQKDLITKGLIEYMEKLGY